MWTYVSKARSEAHGSGKNVDFMENMWGILSAYLDLRDLAKWLVINTVLSPFFATPLLRAPRLEESQAAASTHQRHLKEVQEQLGRFGIHRKHLQSSTAVWSFQV